MNELIEAFLPESRELVEQATRDLLVLEKEPLDRERLDSAFRAFHTLKGGAGIVEFAAMERAVHAAENVLEAARSGSRPITPSVIEDCFTCLDRVVTWLDALEGSGAFPPGADADADAIVARFDSTPEAPRPAAALPLERDSSALPAAARELLHAQVLLLDAPLPSQGAAGRIASVGIVAANVLRRIGRDADADRIARAAAAALAEVDPQPLRNAVDEALRETAQPASQPAGPSTAPPLSAQTLRIDAAKIDALVKLTSELTVANNAIGHAARLARESENALAATLRSRHAVLDRLVRELQQVVLAMRVLPLRHVFQRFPRLVRELSADLGKAAVLVIEGEETEADKAIVEMLFEPLLHVMRNALGHGVEPPAQRIAQGKARAATVRLTAEREGEHVLVEVSDDGRGIDVDRVRAAALERGLASRDTLAAMTDAQALDLIFVPGFSTSAEVTGVSGRGVGMDAVRTAVQRLAGQVLVESRPGQGTTVRFRLPFSVMMTPVMTVQVGGQLFGIPLDAIVETVRVPAGSIARVGAAHAVVLRDRTIPLVELGGTLGVEREERREKEATLVIASIEGETAAIRVDALGERIEVMLKPLDGFLSNMPGIAGSTLLGDGTVLLVLDLVGLLALPVQAR